jgi:hypothetical protein
MGVDLAAPSTDTPPEASFFNGLNDELSNKGFLVVGTEELFDDLRPCLLRGRDDPCEHAAL